MSLSAAAFDDLRSHWAVSAIGADRLERAHTLVRERLARRAVGKQIAFSFAADEEHDTSFLERVALAYELAMIEGLDELSRPSGTNDALRDQAVAAAFHGFDVRRVLPVPRETEDRLFFVLQISAAAYCGDRWSDLRRWYQENQAALTAPSVADVSWDRRLLYRLFHCWVRLFRKSGWDDLDRIREIIAGLRNDQRTFEAGVFQDDDSRATDRGMAWRLAALYHWAKGTEVLADYMLQGRPSDPFGQLDKHFEGGIQSAAAGGDMRHEVVMRWLHAAGRIMITNSLWWATRTVNSRTWDFVRSLTRREHRALFELLPPQRAAVLEQGLLDQAKTAIVVDLPTSGGKTLLAQFRILQALQQFEPDHGWIAYVAPTRALTAQITSRLRRDFAPIGVRVEQLTAAVEVDAFEEQLLTDRERLFHVLVSTPEKLSLVIRNRKVDRPLALVVLDEAHNLETVGRGLRIELLLATIKRDCPRANFLLLMPHVENVDAVARWLAQDVDAGRSISLGSTPWKPNERIVGLYRADADDSVRGGWRLWYETLTTTEKTMPLRGTHRVDGARPINVPRSQVLGKGRQKGLGLQTAAIATVMSARGTSIAVANNIRTVWRMAGEAARSLPAFDAVPEDIRLVQDFLRTEIDPDFQLVETLDRGVGVHHAGLSDEVRTLMEWLAANGTLRVLCATSTIAQGIDFPVSSVFLASRFVPQGAYSTEMSAREFWNLVGRAGRIGHDSVGVVGLAEGGDRRAVIDFVSRSTGALVSRLVTLLDELAARGALARLPDVLWQEQWEDFRCYVAHLWAEKKNLDEVLADSEQLLRQTYGYTALRDDPARRDRAEALLSATRSYARELAARPQHVVELADATGFSPEGVVRAMTGLRNLGEKLVPSNWTPESLFGAGGRIADLFGVMLRIPQLQRQLDEIGGKGVDSSRVSDIARDWVNGKGIGAIAREYFASVRDEQGTAALTDACRAIYRVIVNNGTWGVSALSRMAGIDFDALPEPERRRINALPAMIYHGVNTEDAVLMRMNSVPRSAAGTLGDLYRDATGGAESRYSVSEARDFLQGLGEHEWNSARPPNAALSGARYKRLWEILSGEAS